MKGLNFVILVLALVLLTACALTGGVTQTDEVTQTPLINVQTNTPSSEPGPTVSPTPTPTAMPKPTAEITETPKPTQAQFIPDIIINSANKVNSNYTLYEDENHIFYSQYWGDMIYCINKETGQVQKKIEVEVNSFAYYKANYIKVK